VTEILHHEAQARLVYLLPASDHHLKFILAMSMNGRLIHADASGSMRDEAHRLTLKITSSETTADDEDDKLSAMFLHKHFNTNIHQVKQIVGGLKKFEYGQRGDEIII
jgi:hypothetical protein